MENNLENKARFFAQYWGQFVFKTNHEASKYALNEVDITSINHDWLNDGLLELKPLSSITDEDAVGVAKIEGYNPVNKVTRDKYFINVWVEPKNSWDYNAKVCIPLNGGYIEHDNNQTYEDNATTGVTPSAYDYLRSKGYSLTYMGLSVDKQIEYGWIKLVE